MVSIFSTSSSVAPFSSFAMPPMEQGTSRSHALCSSHEHRNQTQVSSEREGVRLDRSDPARIAWCRWSEHWSSDVLLHSVELSLCSPSRPRSFYFDIAELKRLTIG